MLPGRMFQASGEVPRSWVDLIISVSACDTDQSSAVGRKGPDETLGQTGSVWLSPVRARRSQRTINTGEL